MIDRRDVLIGSAAALAASVFTSTTPALAQGTTVPGTKRGFLDRPGCRIYYEVTGSGPPIIFAHGLGSNHLTWWQQVPHFSDRYTCVTFAHRTGERDRRPRSERFCRRSRGSNRAPAASRRALGRAIDGRLDQH
jgi:hypothetical protein